MKSKWQSKSALFVALTALLGGVVLFAASPTQAVVNNPGAVTFTIKGGSFTMNKNDPDGDPPLSFDFPDLLGPWECNDGIDNDLDGNVDGADGECDAIAGTYYGPNVFAPHATNQADTSEAMDGYQGVWECNDGIDNDLDGFYDHSSVNATNPDSGGVAPEKNIGCTYANDNEEDYFGNQFYKAPTFTGSIAGDGSVSVTAANFQQSMWVSFDASAILGPGSVILANITMLPEGFPWTGTINPDSGAGDVSMDGVALTIKITVQGIGSCRIGEPGVTPIMIDGLTTGTSGSLTGAPATPGGTVARIVRGDFPMNVDVIDEPGLTCGAIQEPMKDMLDLPNSVGNGNDAAFFLESSFAPLGNGSLSGTVTEAGSGTPLQGISVRARDKATNTYAGSAKTKADGSFFIGGLPPGDYVIWYYDQDGSHESTFNGGVWPVTKASALTVAASADTNADQALAAAGTVGGTVTEDPSGTPLGGVNVRVRDLSDNFVTATTTAGDGTWSLVLPAGDYVILFEDGGTHIQEFANEQPGRVKADTVTVGASGNVVVDAALALASVT